MTTFNQPGRRRRPADRHAIAQRLGAVSRRLAAITGLGACGHERMVLPYIAFLDALQLALDALRADEAQPPEGEALAAELEAAVSRPAAADVPALVEIGLRRAGAAGWEVAYLELEYHIQRRPAVMLAVAVAFERRFRAFRQAAMARLEPQTAA